MDVRIEVVIGATAQNHPAAIAASVMAANCDLSVRNCDLRVTFTENLNTLRGPKFQPKTRAYSRGASDVQYVTRSAIAASSAVRKLAQGHAVLEIFPPWVIGNEWAFSVVLRCDEDEFASGVAELADESEQGVQIGLRCDLVWVEVTLHLILREKMKHNKRATNTEAKHGAS